MYVQVDVQHPVKRASQLVDGHHGVVDVTEAEAAGTLRVVSSSTPVDGDISVCEYFNYNTFVLCYVSVNVGFCLFVSWGFRACQQRGHFASNNVGFCILFIRCLLFL